MHTDRIRWLVFYLCSSVFIGGYSLFLSGCDRKPTSEVVLYTSVDQPFAEPIAREFEKQTGIQVRLVTDTEATKSVGLSERLRAEKSNPQADVWWSNEPFLTISLANEDLLQPYASPAANDVPAQFKDPDHRWTGVAIRARMLVTYRGGDPPRKPLRHLDDLLDPSLKDQITIARPTAGTTGGHVAALYVLWGDDKATTFFKSLHNNGVKLVGGNSVVAEMVGQGTCLAGLTDNDDVYSATSEGAELHATLPDQDTFGTLAMPTTVGLVAGRPDNPAARKLIDYLLSKEVEQKLLDAHFAYASVRAAATSQPSPPRWMQVDYREVARVMPQAVRKATSILEGRE